jgi:hypothetical protein
VDLEQVAVQASLFDASGDSLGGVLALAPLRRPKR